MPTMDCPRPRTGRPPGRPSMKPGSKTPPDVGRVLRNLGLAYLRKLGLTVSELSAVLGIPVSTVRQALAAAGPVAAVLAPEEPRDEAAERVDRNGRRRRTKPIPQHDAA